MPVFIDPRTGERYENVPDEDVESARSKFGLISEEEFAHQQAVQDADRGIGSAIGKGYQRAAGMMSDVLQGFTPPAVGSDAFGMGGPAPAAAPAAEVQSGPETYPEAYTEQARLEREAHPIASGLGGALAMAPYAGLAAAAAPGIAPVLGTSVGAIGAEAAVGGVQQEYDDAWFEQRPFELKNVAANTLMFAGLDFAFRGALRGLGAAMSIGKQAAETTSEIGSRNVVSEAQGAAREIGVEPATWGSVGAARADDMVDAYDSAVAQMTDSEAATLARDAEDHAFLVAQDASEAMTRINNGLSDDLGSKLKYEDFSKYATELDDKTLERQAAWLSDTTEEASQAARTLESSTYNLGNWGKRAVETIDTFSRRIGEESDPGRRNFLTDEFKKRLDRLTKSIDASDADGVLKEEIKGAIAPTREALRKGLENPKLWGGSADLQKSVNAPWTGLLESWTKVQNTLTEATGHVKFDTTGAGRITRESTVDRMMAIAEKDPRRNQEFGKHLRNVLDNVRGLVDARRAHGLSGLDGLDELEGSVVDLMEDWNLATTIGVAKNRVSIMKRDPRKWGALAMSIGERLPIVGEPIKIGRSLSEALTDLHLPKNSAIGKVWDSAYKRFATNPVYSDPSIIRNYPDWIAESLRARGGSVPPPAGGMAGAPAIPGMPPANEGGAARSVASPPAAATGKSAIERARARISQGGYNELGFRGGLPEGDTAAAAKLREQVKNLPDGGSLYDLPEGEYPSDLVQKARASLPDDEKKAIFRDYTGSQYKQIRSALRGEGEHASAPLVKRALEKMYVDNPTSAGPLYRGISVSDSALNAAMSQGEFTTSAITSTSSSPIKGMGFARSAGMQGRRDLNPILIKFNKVDRGAPINSGESEFLLPEGGHFKVTGRKQVEGVLVLEVEQTGKASAQQLKDLGSLGSVDLGARVGGDGPNFTLGGVAKSPMGVVTGAGVGLGLNAAMRDDQPPPPRPSPDAAYRDALREIDQAGTLQVRSLASDALRKKPPRGRDRDPLALFAGKGSIQDAVEKTRERLDEIAADPTTLLQQLGKSAGELGKTHPSVQMAVVEKTAQVAAYLQAVIPQRTGTSLLDQRGAPVSFDRAWDYAARYVGATQPRAALREVVRGSAPPEMLEAVQQNWPEVWQSFQAEMLGQVQRMHAAGKHIPSEKLRRLDALLGLRGQLDPSASVEVAQHFLMAQDADAQRRQQQAGGSGSGGAPSGGAARAALQTRLGAISAERTAG